MAETPPEPVAAPDAAAPELTATAQAPALPEAAGKVCSCGHGKTAHEHYRRGADCSLCACTRFSRRGRPSLPFIGR